MRRALGLIPMVVLGCTEPNPFQMHASATDESGSGSSGGPSTSSDPTGVTTSMTSTTATTDADTTMSATTVDPTDTATTVSDESTSTGEPTCAHTCVALPPGDWQGPAAVLHEAPDDPSPTCTGDFTASSDPVFANLDAAAASCSCDCEDPVGASCSQVELVVDGNNDCGSPTTTWSFNTSCYNNVTGNANLYWQATAAIDAGSCDPTENFVIPDATWGDRFSACGMGSTDTIGCDPGTACVPVPAAPYDGRLCIWHDGDQQCPTDIGYDVRTVYYRNFADDRDCEACSCGDVEGECSGTLYLFNPASCSGSPTQTLTIGGSCLQAVLGIESADVSGAGLTPTASASCAPSDSQPTGQAEGIDPVTFCCDS